ncbi:MAG: hypothetical protein R2838_09170 [Caldilineaceae bacterium]
MGKSSTNVNRDRIYAGRREIRGHGRASAYVGLAYGSLGTGVIYAVLAVMHWFVLPADGRPILMTLAGVTSVLLFAFGWCGCRHLRRRQSAQSLAHPLCTGTVELPGHLYLVPEPQQTMICSSSISWRLCALVYRVSSSSGLCPPSSGSGWCGSPPSPQWTTSAAYAEGAAIGVLLRFVHLRIVSWWCRRRRCATSMYG